MKHIEENVEGKNRSQKICKCLQEGYNRLTEGKANPPSLPIPSPTLNTICIVSYTPKEILFASDQYRYHLKEGTVEDVLTHRLEINHSNFKEHIKKQETNVPKIHKLTKTSGLIAGGDGRFYDVLENLDKRKNIPKQILQRLQQKQKLKAFWCCHIASFRKGKVQLFSIFYNNGEVTTQQSQKDNVEFSAFAPEMKDIFQKRIMAFYMANTTQKIQIVKDFFSEISELYSGLAGGQPIFATINSEGFKWVN